MHAQIDISLVGVKPRVARTLLVPASINLRQLHYIFQAAFGWEDFHPYEFRSEDLCWSCQNLYLGSHNEQIDEAVTLDEVLALWRASGAVYTYDFSARWTHQIRIVSLQDSLPENKVSFLLDGTGICPPEGTGGPHGMIEAFDIVGRTPGHPMRQDFLTYRDFCKDIDYQSAIIASQACQVAETSLRLIKEEKRESSLPFDLVE